MFRTGLLTLAVGLMGAQAAWAAPDRTITLGPASPVVEFEGVVTDFNTVTGAAGEDVEAPGWDMTLIKVEAAGPLAITTTSDGLPTSEIDLTLYLSDAEGTRGAQVSQGLSDGPEETVRLSAKAGYYLLRASGWPAVNAAFKGIAKLMLPPAPVAAPAAPALAPAPAAAGPKKRTKAGCKRKARRIKSARKRRAALRRCAKLS